MLGNIDWGQIFVVATGVAIGGLVAGFVKNKL